MTNAEMFQEVFGFEPNTNAEMPPCTTECEQCKYYVNYDCRCEWWWEEQEKVSGKRYDNLFEEIEKRQRKIEQLESKLNRIYNLCSFGELEKMERIKEICEETDDPSMNRIRQDYGLESITKHERS